MKSYGLIIFSRFQCYTNRDRVMKLEETRLKFINSAGILACGFWLALFHIANVNKFGLMCQIDESGDYLSGNRHSDG